MLLLLLMTQTLVRNPEKTDQPSKPSSATRQKLGRFSFSTVAAQVGHDIGNSKGYIKDVNDLRARAPQETQETITKDSMCILGKAALEIAQIYEQRAETTGSSLDDRRARIAEFISTYEYKMVDDIKERDRKKRGVKGRKSLATRERYARYNHALREIINDWGSRLTQDELIQYMFSYHPRRALLQKNPTARREWLETTKADIEGVKIEMGFELAIDRTNISWYSATPIQDAKGVDYIVNGVPIDLKRSYSSAQEAQYYNNLYGRSKVAVCPDIRPKDFVDPKTGKTMLVPQNPEAVALRVEQSLRNSGVI